MPTEEKWLETGILSTTWIAPLTSRELELCFSQLAEMLEASEDTIHVLFDLSDGPGVPSNAPIIAIRSKFLVNPHAGRVAVVGMHPFPRVLARIASRATSKDILFFNSRAGAIKYLKETP